MADKTLEIEGRRSVNGASDQYEEINEKCPIRQVELTVPKTDDPSLPILTFRMWVLGVVSCVILSFLNQFFWYRKQPLIVSSISAQIAVVPIGHFMATTLPNRVFLKDTRFEFSLNPGPFNVKEHVLITIFANSGAGTVYASHILTAVKVLYKRKLAFLPAFLVMLTTQVRNQFSSILFLSLVWKFCHTWLKMLFACICYLEKKILFLSIWVGLFFRVLLD